MLVWVRKRSVRSGFGRPPKAWALTGRGTGQLPSGKSGRLQCLGDRQSGLPGCIGPTWRQAEDRGTLATVRPGRGNVLPSRFGRPTIAPRSVAPTLLTQTDTTTVSVQRAVSVSGPFDCG
jgi:hypothetical protein